MSETSRSNAGWEIQVDRDTKEPMARRMSVSGGWLYQVAIGWASVSGYVQWVEWTPPVFVPWPVGYATEPTEHRCGSLKITGSYYSVEHDNFYCRSCKKGLGEAFYKQWWPDRQDECFKPPESL